MKAIKKACSGTTLYPKASSVSSKLKTGGKIKKAQYGNKVAKDKTSVYTPDRKPETVRVQPTYKNAFGEKANLNTAKDTADYKSGYNSSIENKGNSDLYRALSTNKAWNAGSDEGRFKNPSTQKLKSGGKLKKGGMKAYEKSSYDKKMDANGVHGKEGSAKDMKADKIAAKKLGYAKTGTKITPKAKDGKNWIQKAINPKHKGFCTPQTKKSCTPKRKALAQTLRKIAKKK